MIKRSIMWQFDLCVVLFELVLLINIKGCLALEASATYQCLDSISKILKFKLVKNDDVISDIYGKDSAATCSLTQNHVTGAGTAADPYRLDVTIDVLGGSPRCGLIEDNTDVYSLKIITQALPNVLQATDKEYSFTCDYTTAVGIETQATVTNVNLQSGSIADEGFGLELKIITSGSDTGITEAELGTLVILRASVDTSLGAKGLSVEDCDAVSPDNAIIFHLTNPKGCAHIDAETILTGQFTKANPEATVSESPSFALFTFTTTNIIKFTCKVKLCFLIQDPDCIDQQPCEDGPPIKRRKRAAQPENPVTAKVSTELKICSPGQCLKDGSASQHTGGILIEPTVSLSIMLVLLIIWLVTIVICVFTCWLVLRMRRNCTCHAARRGRKSFSVH